MRCAHTAPTSSSATSQSFWTRAMIQHPAFPVEPWTVRETALHLDHLAQTESVFALSNGHIGLRGNLDEGEPFGIPGTYLAGLYEERPCLTPRPATATPRRARRWSTSPMARSFACSSRTSRSTSATGSCASTSGCSTCARRPAPQRRVGVADRAYGARHLDTAGVLLAAGRSPRSCYEVEPLAERMPVVVQSELVANEPCPARQTIRARPRRRTRRCARRATW